LSDQECEKEDSDSENIETILFFWRLARFFFVLFLSLSLQFFSKEERERRAREKREERREKREERGERRVLSLL
jgi:hypothetical protein